MIESIATLSIIASFRTVKATVEHIRLPCLNTGILLLNQILTLESSPSIANIRNIARRRNVGDFARTLNELQSKTLRCMPTYELVSKIDIHFMVY